ncbi:conserved hypothetical protein [uncultured Desulfobacterium sp.]|uniref:Hydantoinase B/oxoprolinase domain-containing protein n=1 Tax=uncultured Desulfobacterium sp. TaxID=201089 RepID=A0A445MVT6_9BACT|nr:conserved hypothetical protein [uncultured Desulfobacterium sp.]
MDTNPVLLEIFKNRFSSVAEEMGVTLHRTAFSPNIKERRDLSCAIFDRNGDMIAQAAHIPVHLGSMPQSVRAAIDNVPFNDQDMVVLNDPFKGGSHLPDITIVAPVFASDQRPSFYVATRAHHSDIGGMSSGSMPLSTSIFQEGLIIPPLKIVEAGKIDQKVMGLILNNVRTPAERHGDFAAQIMANVTGVRRMRELIERYSLESVDFYARRLMDYADAGTRKTIRDIPDGVYSFDDFMDDDGIADKNIKIHVTITINGEEASADFRGSAPQVLGSINAVFAITLSAVHYVFRSLANEDIPVNAGSFRPIKVLTDKGSVLDAQFPAAVAAGNVELSQRIVDVVLGALSRAVPERVPAASQGTMNNLTIGGYDPKNSRPFSYYETIGGGMGAGAMHDGENAIHCHMTNTLNTPVEAIEYSCPFLVTEYSVRRGSGGKGLHRGGDGITRQVELLTDADVTVLSERRKFPPYGLLGGMPGRRGRNIIVSDGEEKEMPGKFSIKLKKGDIIRIETPGGGGYG